MADINQNERLAYSVPDACRVLGIGRTNLYAEFKAGRLLPCKVGKRTLVERSEMQRWLAASRLTAAEAAALAGGAVS